MSSTPIIHQNFDSRNSFTINIWRTLYRESMTRGNMSPILAGATLCLAPRGIPASLVLILSFGCRGRNKGNAYPPIPNNTQNDSVLPMRCFHSCSSWFLLPFGVMVGPQSAHTRAVRETPFVFHALSRTKFGQFNLWVSGILKSGRHSWKPMAKGCVSARIESYS